MARRKGQKSKVKLTSMTNQQKIGSLRIDRNHPVPSQWKSINDELLKTKKDLAKVRDELARALAELKELKGENQ